MYIFIARNTFGTYFKNLTSDFQFYQSHILTLTFTQVWHFIYLFFLQTLLAVQASLLLNSCHFLLYTTSVVFIFILQYSLKCLRVKCKSCLFFPLKQKISGWNWRPPCYMSHWLTASHTVQPSELLVISLKYHIQL